MSTRKSAAMAVASPRPARRVVEFHPEQAKFTLPQAGAFSGQTRSALYRAFNAGLLTPQKFLGRTVIDGDELRTMLGNLPTAPVRMKDAP